MPLIFDHIPTVLATSPPRQELKSNNCKVREWGGYPVRKTVKKKTLGIRETYNEAAYCITGRKRAGKVELNATEKGDHFRKGKSPAHMLWIRYGPILPEITCSLYVLHCRFTCSRFMYALDRSVHYFHFS